MQQRRFRAAGLQRQIQVWKTDDPRELEQQLREYQKEVNESLLRASAGAWRLQERFASAGTHAVQAGELLMLEPVTGDAIVKLPELTGAVLGQLCGVARLSPRNDVKVFATVQRKPGESPATSPRGRIDGVQRNRTPLSLPALGARVFLATSKGWMSVGGASDHGVYTPEVSGLSNFSVSAIEGRFSRVGNVCHVGVSIQGENTSTSTPKQVHISLPVPPAGGVFTVTELLGGGIAVPASTAAIGHVSIAAWQLDTTATMRLTCGDTNGANVRRWNVNFSYVTD